MGKYLSIVLVPTSQAETISPATQVSTGTRSAVLSESMMVTRRRPDAHPAQTPVGPYMLSTHPGIGSLYVDRTGTPKQVDREVVNC